MTLTIDIGNIAVALAALAAIWFSFCQSNEAIKNQSRIENERLFRSERDLLTSEISNFIFEVNYAIDCTPIIDPMDRNDVLIQSHFKEQFDLASKHRADAIRRSEFLFAKYAMGTEAEKKLCDSIQEVLGTLPNKTELNAVKKREFIQAKRNLNKSLHEVINSYKEGLK